MEHQTEHPDNSQRKIITIPNLLSLFRVCLIPVIVWLYIVEERYFEAGCVLVLSGVTDIVDGFIARQCHMVSDLGKVLDPLADKLTQAAMLACLLLRFPLMTLPLVFLGIKETCMAVTGALVIKKTGIVPGAVWHGKAATLLLYTTMLFHIFWPEMPPTMSVTLIVACTMMIGISFVLYMVRNIKLLRRSKEMMK